MMTTGQKTVTAYLLIACVLLLALVELAHWQSWAAMLVVALPGVAWAAASRFGRRSPSAAAEHAPETAVVPASPEPAFERVSVAGVRLPSNRRDYDFVFSATIRWYPAQNDSRGHLVVGSAVAVDFVVQRASEIAGDRDPAHLSLVEHEMRRALGELVSDPHGHVYAMAEAVGLALLEDDQQRLDQLAAVRKNEDLWDHQRRYEQSKRQYLGNDVLKSPGSAVVWWLARNETGISEVAEKIPVLQRLSHAANNVNGFAASVPGPGGGPEADEGEVAGSAAARHFEAFMDEIGIVGANYDRTVLGHQVARLVAQRGHQDLADELFARFDVPGGMSDDASVWNDETSDGHGA